MRDLLAAFGAGLLFSLGLAISGMTRPDKVIGFLDVTGSWDPSLAFVMIGAIGVHFFAYRLLPRMRSPVFAERFALPTRQDIDGRLIAGAILFGMGWGIGGFCPGPAIVSVTGGLFAVLPFIAAMVVGMGLFEIWDRRNAAQ
ncbi:MAG: DUF6691 family protein [Myxococcota bacterium]